jgi:hypothetical protein
VKNSVKYAVGVIFMVSMAGGLGCSVDPFFVPVESISGVPETGIAGTPLVLTAAVNPGFATNTDINWSILYTGSPGASIERNTLYTEAEGAVWVRAIIVNGTGAGKDYTQEFFIVIVENGG